MTSIRKNLVFSKNDFAQDEGLKNFYLRNYLVDCDEL